MVGKSVTPASVVANCDVFPTWPMYAQDEQDAVVRVLRSGAVNYWTGQEGRVFEAEFAGYVGAAHAVALTNGSRALGIGLRALGIGDGAEVIVTPRTFVASASEILLVGATPVFADVDLDSQNITVESIEPLISDRTSAILPVHLAGWPCDMPGIRSLADERGIAVIEDCAQAHGASVDGRKVGAWGDIAAFSFCQDKIMSTCGEGGMLVTGDRELWSRSWSFKDHGKRIDCLEPQTSGSQFRWLHESLGTNDRMTEMQAAVGRCQLRKLDTWVTQRRANAARLNEHFSEIEALRTTIPGSNVEHTYYKYYCFVRPERLKPGWSRDRILDAVRQQGVPAGSGICPEVYLEKGLVNAGCRPDRRLANARELGETSIMLPVHPMLEPAHMDRMADVITSVLSSAAR